MDVEQLQAIEERANAATPGPWELDESPYDYAVFAPHPSESGNTCIAEIDGGLSNDSRRDGTFIVHAREDVPALIAEVRRLQSENSTLVRRARGLEDNLETANETIAVLSAQIDETPYDSIWKFVHGTDSIETRQIVRAWLDSNTSDYDEVQP